jgi:acetolactate synthase-1/2/3 large subunit
VERAAVLIEKATRPIILAGNGVIRNHASSDLTKFAEQLQIPVVHTFMGKGVIPWTSAMSLLTVGVLPRDYEIVGFDDSDLVICVGYDFVEYDPRSWNRRGHRRIVHVDTLPAEISAHYVPEVEVTGEIRESLQMLVQRVKRARPSTESRQLHETVLKMLESELGEHGRTLMKPQRILWDLRDILEPDDLLISDVGAHKIWLGRFFRAVKPGTVFISNGLSAMGIALPGGIAAKLNEPDRRVVTLSGDGGFLMSVHELETARRERTATVNLVFRDGGLGSIRWKQSAKFNRTIGTEFGNPDFSELAKAFGIRGFRVDRPSELNSILSEALEAKVPCLVDIPVDYGQNPFLNVAN